MRTDTPVQIKLADYSPYPFAIEHVEMAFHLDPGATAVRTKMTVKRLSEGPLILDGVQLELNAILNTMVDAGKNLRIVKRRPAIGSLLPSYKQFLVQADRTVP